MKKAVPIIVVFILLPILSMANPKPQYPMVSVDVYKVGKPKDKEVILTYPARLRAVKSVDVVARVSGTILKKHYTEGKFVKKGQILYTIEQDIYRARYNEALANLSMAKATLYKAKKDWNRYKNLFKSKAISKQKLDYAYASYQNALSSVKLAQAKLKLAEIDLNYTQPKAPISGFTSLKMVDVGDYVRPSQKLLTITQTDPIYAEFSFPDSDYLRIKNYLTTNQWEADRLRAFIKVNGKTINGKIDFIDSVIDPKTSTVKARAVFPNPNGTLMPNEFVRIKVVGFKQKNVIVIPSEAVLQNSMGKMVFVVQNGRVGVRMIKAREAEGNTFIVQYGLKPGDLVIIDNFFRIKPGMPVKVDKVIEELVK
ncbi:efflux RND transporter periplasmic adaptor subunit [Hippea sp. KM1]|uniref:efflux RND transporter periplasmic adaptor subunit n=1 Tax=Hippea sp. KM1 TaxID=944481 RepID=UPI00046CFC06|nr:efflux RND transporter periplasmic adaptor subunit [Hippea sp. KM1]